MYLCQYVDQIDRLLGFGELLEEWQAGHVSDISREAPTTASVGCFFVPVADALSFSEWIGDVCALVRDAPEADTAGPIERLQAIAQDCGTIQPRVFCHEVLEASFLWSRLETILSADVFGEYSNSLNIFLPSVQTVYLEAVRMVSDLLIKDSQADDIPSAIDLLSALKHYAVVPVQSLNLVDLKRLYLLLAPCTRVEMELQIFLEVVAYEQIDIYDNFVRAAGGKLPSDYESPYDISWKALVDCCPMEDEDRTKLVSLANAADLISSLRQKVVRRRDVYMSRLLGRSSDSYHWKVTDDENIQALFDSDQLLNVLEAIDKCRSDEIIPSVLSYLRLHLKTSRLPIPAEGVLVAVELASGNPLFSANPANSKCLLDFFFPYYVAMLKDCGSGKLRFFETRLAELSLRLERLPRFGPEYIDMMIPIMIGYMPESSSDFGCGEGGERGFGHALHFYSEFGRPLDTMTFNELGSWLTAKFAGFPPPFERWLFKGSLNRFFRGAAEEVESQLGSTFASEYWTSCSLLLTDCGYYEEQSVQDTAASGLASVEEFDALDTRGITLPITPGTEIEVTNTSNVTPPTKSRRAHRLKMEPMRLQVYHWIQQMYAEEYEAWVSWDADVSKIALSVVYEFNKLNNGPDKSLRDYLLGEVDGRILDTNQRMVVARRVHMGFAMRYADLDDRLRVLHFFKRTTGEAGMPGDDRVVGQGNYNEHRHEIGLARPRSHKTLGIPIQWPGDDKWMIDFKKNCLL